MKIHEYQAKEILARYKIPLLQGHVAATPEEAQSIALKINKPVAVKAQVHVGGRGKAGGIRLVKNAAAAAAAARDLLGKPLKGLMVNKVLIEEQAHPEKEFYLGLTVDRRLQQNALIFSGEGGVDIEELAATKPQAITTLAFDPSSPSTDAALDTLLAKTGVPDAPVLKTIIYTLGRLYKELDADLAEINPLSWSKSRAYLALDAKITIDDNALFRQPDLSAYREESETDDIEREARRRQIAYVRMGGNVGIIGNGAGLVMGTMDEVNRAGGHPANFLDIGGGAKAEVVKNALELVLMDKNVKGIFLNIFGGITRCDEVARGLIAATEATRTKLPLVIRLAGTKAEEGRALLAQTSLIPVSSMQEGARKIVELIRS